MKFGTKTQRLNVEYKVRVFHCWSFQECMPLNKGRWQRTALPMS